jgi:hypothetical protein
MQELPGCFDAAGKQVNRANILQHFFFYTRQNQDWTGIGYVVWPEDPNYPYIGTLYRFSTNNIPRDGPFSVDALFAALIKNPALPVPPSFSRVADGVVHFRARAFANTGFPFFTVNNATNGYFWSPGGPNGNFKTALDTFVYGDNVIDPVQSACYFTHGAVPAYVEVELGILEQSVLQRYRSIPIQDVKSNYLYSHTAQVHIFRQRVPIRNLDFSAYP